MRSGIVFVCLLLLSTTFSGCWIQEATPEKKQSLIIVSDYLSKEDSLLIKQFSKQFHIDVKTHVLTQAAILQRVKAGHYNAEIDILITENKALREALYDLGAWKRIRQQSLFEGLEKQFRNKHHLWVPLSHDPLLVTYPSDTNNLCKPIDFKRWHRRHGKDSIPPMIRLKASQQEYASQLAKTEYLKWLKVIKPANYWSTERVYSLSGFVDKLSKPDSTFQAASQNCRYYLTDKKQFVTRTLTAGMYSFHRNTEAAERFLRFYCAHDYSVAEGRNQLPARTDVTVSWKIKSANIQ